MSPDVPEPISEGWLPDPDASQTIRPLLDAANARPGMRRLLPAGLVSLGLHLFFLPLLLTVTVTFADDIGSLGSWGSASYPEQPSTTAQVNLVERDYEVAQIEMTLPVAENQPEASSQPRPQLLGDAQPQGADLEIRGADADAEVFLNGTPTGARGSCHFSVVLPPNSPPVAEFTVTVRSTPNGTPVEQTRLVKLVAGRTTVVDFSSSRTPPGVPPATLAAGSGSMKQRSDEELLLAMVNQHRKAKGKKPLTANPVLFAIARAHAANMTKQEMLDDEVDGMDTSARVVAGGYKSVPGQVEATLTADANLSPASACRAWIDNAAANEILLSPTKDTGIGMARDAKGQVYYSMILASPAK
ncbi:hypothetical protein AYO44_16530 [Planctomycetaceae bacterium SCGC AG-212-F19]|nr:hypothetical protein AYO44_16530 [Planctomycetaceae bacterium SCGC AG-212-F19]